MTNTITENFTKEIETLIDSIGTEVLTSYTLADAIREGASVTKQAHGTFGSAGKSCALTAAALAAQARGYTK